MEILEKIRKLQYERDWNDYDLAKNAEISVATVNSLFRRKSPPKLETLQCICNAFNMTLAQFFLDDENFELLSNSEREMLAAFRKLSPKQQQALIAVFTDQK